MAKMRDYYRPVVNQAGYVLMFPNVADEEDLLQSYPPNPYAQSETQQFPLGTKLIQGERVWRYAHAGEALVIAAPLQSPARAHAEQDDDIVCGAAAAIGTYDVSVTSTANLDTSPNDSKDNFKDGYLIVNDEAGEGQMYKIKEAPALSGTDKSIFKLYDPLTIALTTSSELGLIKNPYKDVVDIKAVATGHPIGVALLAITNGYYFWCQSGGPAPVVANAAVSLGTKVVVGTTEGKVDPASAATTELTIGYPLTPGVTTDEYFMVFLTLDS